MCGRVTVISRVPVAEEFHEAESDLICVRVREPVCELGELSITINVNNMWEGKSFMVEIGLCFTTNMFEDSL